MRILITGAAGFIGQAVVEALLAESSNSLTLTDLHHVPVPGNTKPSKNTTVISGDLLDSAKEIAAPGFDAAILLHGIMSSGAEANFELGYRVNVDATRAIIDALAKSSPGIKIIYASSEAVYGRPVPKTNMTEDDIPAPEMSYGCQKSSARP